MPEITYTKSEGKLVKSFTYSLAEIDAMKAEKAGYLAERAERVAEAQKFGVEEVAALDLELSEAEKVGVIAAEV